MVPEAGLEPARYFYRGILSPLCLPIPPLGHTNRYQFFLYYTFLNSNVFINWRLKPESNRRKRLCRPLHNHSAIQPLRIGIVYNSNINESRKFIIIIQFFLYQIQYTHHHIVFRLNELIPQMD